MSQRPAVYCQLLTYVCIDGANVDTEMDIPKPSLLTRFYGLPEELRDLIRVFLLQAILQPGKVFPELAQFDHKESSVLVLRPGIIESFGIKDNLLLTKARDFFYANNTWVIARGDRDAFYFLDAMNGFSAGTIVSLELSFRWDDNWRNTLKRQACIQERLQKTSPLGHTVAPDEVWEQYLIERPEELREVWQIWLEKITQVVKLPLQHLRLEYESCPDVPPRLMLAMFDRSRYSSPPFAHGLPPHLELIAPTPDLEAAWSANIKSKYADGPQLVTECSLCVKKLHERRKVASDS